MSRVRTSIIATALMIGAPFSALTAEVFNDTQKTEIEKLVHGYLLKNPDVIVEAINALQRRDEAASAEKQRAAMASMSSDLTSSPNDPVMGNPNGDVTMVEFFDYRCGFCKRVFGDTMTLLKEDGNIRFVLKEFPILGDDSVFASRAAMAVWLHQRDKYEPLHAAMMSSKGALSNDKVLGLAKEVGVDTAALVENMKDPEIDKTLSTTMAQAQALGITGTPAFIIGESMAPGAIPLETMKKLVDTARGK